MALRTRTVGPPFPAFSRSTFLDVERDFAAEGTQTLHYRHLAIRIIDLALRDLTNPVGSAEDRASAQTFLAGSGMLAHWCAVAELDPARLVRHAKTLRIPFHRFRQTKEVTWQQQ